MAVSFVKRSFLVQGVYAILADLSRCFCNVYFFIDGGFMQELTLFDKPYPIIELTGRPKVLLDCHIAEIFNVTTKEVNQAISRNQTKFYTSYGIVPIDYIFQCTPEEKEVVTKCDHLNKVKYSSVMPTVFLPQGCNMLATILNSDVAILRSVQIIEAFTKLEQAYYASKPIFSLPRDLPSRLTRHY